MKFGNILKEGVSHLHENDAILISADHGNDPTYHKHTDHTREYTPYLWLQKNHLQTLDQPNAESKIGQTVDIFVNNERTIFSSTSESMHERIPI